MLPSSKLLPIVTLAMNLIILQAACVASGSPQAVQEVDKKTIRAEASSSSIAATKQDDHEDRRQVRNTRQQQQPDEKTSLAKHNSMTSGEPMILATGGAPTREKDNTSAALGSMSLVGGNASANSNSISAEGSSANSTTKTSLMVSEQQQDADADPAYMQHMTTILVILHLSVFITGLVGNSLVCLSVYRNKSLQTVTNYYIVNLAVADFLVILICLPPTVYWDLTLTWNFGLVLCKLVLYLQSISVSVSVLTLTCISIDRWYAICRPLEFSSTKYRAKVTIGLIWLVSMLIASPDVVFLTTRPLYEENDHIYMDCTYSWPESNTKMYQLCILSLLFLGPFVLMSISYSHIVNVLWRNETMAESLLHSIQLEEEKQFQLKRNRMDLATRVEELGSTISQGDADDRHMVIDHQLRPGEAEMTIRTKTSPIVSSNCGGGGNTSAQSVIITNSCYHKQESRCTSINEQQQQRRPQRRGAGRNGGSEKRPTILCNMPAKQQSIPSNCNQMSSGANRVRQTPEMVRGEAGRGGEQVIVSGVSRETVSVASNQPGRNTKGARHDKREEEEVEQGEDRVSSSGPEHHWPHSNEPAAAAEARITIAHNNVIRHLDGLRVGCVTENDGFSLFETAANLVEQVPASLARPKPSRPDSCTNGLATSGGRIGAERQVAAIAAASRSSRRSFQAAIIEEEQEITGTSDCHNYSGQQAQGVPAAINTSGHQSMAGEENLYRAAGGIYQRARSLSDGSPASRLGSIATEENRLEYANKTRPEGEISVPSERELHSSSSSKLESVTGCNLSNGCERSSKRMAVGAVIEAHVMEPENVHAATATVARGHRQIVQVINGGSIVSGSNANESGDGKPNVSFWRKSWWRRNSSLPFDGKRKQQQQQQPRGSNFGSGDKALSKRYRKNMANYAAHRAKYGQSVPTDTSFEASSSSTTTARVSEGRAMLPRPTTICPSRPLDESSTTGSGPHCQEARARRDPRVSPLFGGQPGQPSVHRRQDRKRIADEQQTHLGYLACGGVGVGATAGGLMTTTVHVAPTNTGATAAATATAIAAPGEDHQLVTSRPNGQNSNSQQSNHHASSQTRFCKLIESRKKAAKMLIVIVIMFGLCYLPIHFLNLLR